MAKAYREYCVSCRINGGKKVRTVLLQVDNNTLEDMINKERDSILNEIRKPKFMVKKDDEEEIDLKSEHSFLS